MSIGENCMNTCVFLGGDNKYDWNVLTYFCWFVCRDFKIGLYFFYIF